MTAGTSFIEFDISELTKLTGPPTLKLFVRIRFNIIEL